MWPYLHVVMVPTTFIMGLFCVLTAILLYPNEEGTIQSTLEDVWLRADDYQKLALTHHAAFMTGIAKLETQFFNRMFGQKLFSVQALGMSFCLSFTPLMILASLGAYLDGAHFASWTPQTAGRVLYCLGLLFCCLAAGAVSLRWRNNSTRLLRGLLIVLSFTALLLGAFAKSEAGSADPSDFPEKATVALFIVILSSYGCDIAFISATRSLLRWAGEMTSSLKVLVAILMNFCLALVFIASGVAISFLIAHSRNQQFDADCNSATLFTSCAGQMVSVGNLFDVLLALLFVGLAAILLVHRALWPLLCRTLFRVQAIGTRGRRSILVAAGFALVSWSGLSVPAWIKSVAKVLSG